MKNYKVVVEFRTAYTSYFATHYLIDAESAKEAQETGVAYAKRINGIPIEILNVSSTEL